MSSGVRVSLISEAIPKGEQGEYMSSLFWLSAPVLSSQSSDCVRCALKQMVFQCSWGRSTWWITGSILLLLAFEITLFTWIGVSNFERSKGAVAVCAVVVAGSLLCLLIPLFYAPKRYLLTSKSVQVVRLGRDIVIPLETIHSARVGEPSELKHTTRMAGVGGLFGHFGQFVNPCLGQFCAYMTRQDQLAVLVTTSGETIVLSPSSPEAFVQAVQEAREKQD